MSNKIIGLAAQLGAGKDTVANYLVKKLNEEPIPYVHDYSAAAPKEMWRRIGFADAVKKVYMDTFNVDLDFIEAWKRKTEVPPGFDMNVRKSLQFIGDGFRQIQSDIWINIAVKSAGKKVISDCRYVNEAKMIHDNGGIVVLLWRQGWENDDPNPSESQIRPFVNYCVENCEDGVIEGGPMPEEMRYYDFFLKNDSSLESLYNKIDTLLIPYLNSRGIK